MTEAWSGILKRYRRANGLTQAALAELLDVEQATVSRWERNFHKPDISIQKRLRDMMRKQPDGMASVIKHRVQCCLSATKLSNRNGHNVAASPAAAMLHRVSQPVLASCDYRPYFSDLLATQWQAAIDSGFFDGEIASIRVYNIWNPIDGGPQVTGMSFWTPVFLPDQEIYLLSDFAVIDEKSFRAVPPNERISIVSMDQIIG